MGLESLSPVAAGVSAGLGLLEGGYQFFSSLHDKKKDEAELEALQQPFYKIQNEFYQNQNLAGQQAQTGLTSTAKDYLTSENERGLGAGIQAILKSGGSAGDISKLYDTFSRSTFNAAAADSEAQQKNIQYFMDVNKDLAGQKITQWSLNEYQPYENKLAQLTESIKADKQNMFGGLNTAIGSLTAAGTSLSNAGLTKSQIGVNNSQADMYGRLFSNTTDPFSSTVDMNAITGGISGNRGTLAGGNPFNIPFETTNTYGE